jgi:hypothetical protein
MVQEKSILNNYSPRVEKVNLDDNTFKEWLH